MRGAHMKMDNQHTGPDWQNAKTGGWNAPPDMADMDDLFDTSDPFLVPDQQPDADPETSEDEAAEDWAAPPFFSKESLGRLGRQFSPVLIPIPFALLIFLFTLPALLHNFSHLPLIPLVSALLVVVLQGVALYYAGADDGRWMLSVVSGYALFLLIWAFALGGLLGSLLMLAFLLIIGGVIGRRAIHVVSEGAADIVLSFGKYSRTLFPGLNFLLPWEKVATRVNTREITWTSNEISMQISRDQEARIMVVVTYQVLPEDAHLVALQMQDWEESLHKHFIAIIKSVLSELSPSDFVAWAHHFLSQNDAVDITNPNIETRWDRINDALTIRLQDEVAAKGIAIHMVHVQDITVPPSLAPITGLHPVMSQRGVDTTMPRAAAQAAPQPQPAQQPAPKPAADRPAPSPPSPIMPTPVPVPSPSMYDSLLETYKSVRAGVLTNPDLIEQLANRFYAIANDAEARSTFPYDALRAANALYQRAHVLRTSPPPAQGVPVPARAEKTSRPPVPNDNLAAGG